MGAAVGNLVAYAAQQHLNQKMGEEKVGVVAGWTLVVVYREG